MATTSTGRLPITRGGGFLIEERSPEEIFTPEDFTDVHHAIARTTPALMGLFSLVTWLAHHQNERGALPVRQAAWYVKERPTFADALAAVRRELWENALFYTLSPRTDVRKLQQALMQRFADALCYAA